ncbi:hypothetical protein [Vibrio furnissii]|uniref:hypothetical protein n=1 Tax=Vibrio furnissii TaxID=29494 RepID=UPI001EEAAAE6|nr:hypothetical protein [Vibrio furnissii]MCG6268628.1 hypothetical protein [Vibrio furnissii]
MNNKNVIDTYEVSRNRFINKYGYLTEKLFEKVSMIVMFLLFAIITIPFLYYYFTVVFLGKVSFLVVLTIISVYFGFVVLLGLFWRKYIIQFVNDLKIKLSLKMINSHKTKLDKIIEVNDSFSYFNLNDDNKADFIIFTFEKVLNLDDLKNYLGRERIHKVKLLASKEFKDASLDNYINEVKVDELDEVLMFILTHKKFMSKEIVNVYNEEFNYEKELKKTRIVNS